MDTVEIAQIGLPSQPVNVDPRTRKGTVKAVVKSAVDRDVLVAASLVVEGDAQASWFTIPTEFRQFELKSKAAGGPDVTIDISYEIPPAPPAQGATGGAAPATMGGDNRSFSIKLRLAADRDPMREFSVSNACQLRLSVPVVKPFVWWPFAVAGGAVAVIGLVIGIVIATRPALGDACKPEKPSCPANAECPERLQHCVARNEALCKKSEECLSNQCTDGQCQALKVKDACDPLASACASDLVCSKLVEHCLASLNGACKSPNDCVTGSCVKDKCGLAIGQPGCVGDGECPPDQKCTKVQGGNACLLKPGEPCEEGADRLCSSVKCVAKKCTRDDGRCAAATVAADCGQRQVCKGDVCLAELGAPCQGATECASGTCANRLCVATMRPCPPCPNLTVCDGERGVCVPFVLRAQAVAVSISQIANVSAAVSAQKHKAIVRDHR